MHYFYLDASAAIKRCLIEVGSPLVNDLFDRAPHDRLLLLTPGLGETLSVLVRRRNTGALSAPAYGAASTALRDELIVAGQVRAP